MPKCAACVIAKELSGGGNWRFQYLSKTEKDRTVYNGLCVNHCDQLVCCCTVADSVESAASFSSAWAFPSTSTNAGPLTTLPSASSGASDNTAFEPRIRVPQLAVQEHDRQTAPLLLEKVLQVKDLSERRPSSLSSSASGLANHSRLRCARCERPALKLTHQAIDCPFQRQPPRLVRS